MTSKSLIAVLAAAPLLLSACSDSSSRSTAPEATLQAAVVFETPPGFSGGSVVISDVQPGPEPSSTIGSFEFQLQATTDIATPVNQIDGITVLRVVISAGTQISAFGKIKATQDASGQWSAEAVWQRSDLDDLADSDLLGPVASFVPFVLEGSEQESRLVEFYEDRLAREIERQERLQVARQSAREAVAAEQEAARRLADIELFTKASAPLALYATNFQPDRGFLLFVESTDTETGVVTGKGVDVRELPFTRFAFEATAMSSGEGTGGFSQQRPSIRLTFSHLSEALELTKSSRGNHFEGRNAVLRTLSSIEADRLNQLVRQEAEAEVGPLRRERVSSDQWRQVANDLGLFNLNTLGGGGWFDLQLNRSFEFSRGERYIFRLVQPREVAGLALIPLIESRRPKTFQPSGTLILNGDTTIPLDSAIAEGEGFLIRFEEPTTILSIEVRVAGELELAEIAGF